MRAFQDYIIKKWRESDDVTDAHATLYEYEWGPREGCSGRYLIFNLIERGTNDRCWGLALWKSGELENVSFLSEPSWVEGLDNRLYEVLNKWTKEYK